MKEIKYISNLTSIDEKYILLTIKTIILLLIIYILKKIGIKILKQLKNDKKEFNYIKKYKIFINILATLIIILTWNDYIKNFITLISLISAGITIAIKDLIFNFFSGIYIKINKPFEIEDRIEINNHKGDVININALNFEILEVNNNNYLGQSTGVITHLPNSTIFSYPLRNYNRAFKYIWNELTIRVPLNSDITKTKSIIYKIINSNEIIKSIPPKMKNQINNIASDYRIYYNHYEPTIYTEVIDNYIELTARYLVHPKKARYVNSCLWNSIITSYQNKEITLYKN